MHRSHILRAVAALTLGLPALGVSADIVSVGRFQNTAWGEVEYIGDYGDHVTSYRRGQDTLRYTLIEVNLTAILEAIGAQGLASVTVIDSGDNRYGGSPGADVDQFRIANLSPEIGRTMLYDGPTSTHQSETSDELWNRVRDMDWGTSGGGLSSGTYVSLGMEGRLTYQLSDIQSILENPDPVLLRLSEAGNHERFYIEIETADVPAPGAIALLGLAGLTCRRPRRR